jgi:tetratricopeptide (TPR) repeat protein
VTYLQQAGDRAAAQAAQAAAADYYQATVDRLERIGRALDAAGVREKLGAVLLAAARYDVAAALDPAATTYRLAGDLEGEGRVTAQIGIAYSRCGMPQEALTRIQPLLERLDAVGPSHALAALCLTRAERGYWVDPLDAIAAAERAAGLASVLGDDVLLVQSEVLRGGILATLGRVEEGLRVLEGVIPRAEAAGHAFGVFGVCEGLNGAARIYDHLGKFALSLHYIERALAAAKRTGDQEWIAFLTMHRGFTVFFSGEWTLARRDGEESLTLYHTIGAGWGKAYPLMVLGFVTYGEGRWEEAEDYLDRCVALADSQRNSALVIALSVRTELDLRQGRPAVAHARLRPLIEDATLGIKEKTTYLMSKLAWAYLEFGDMEAAIRAAAHAVADTRAKRDQLNLVEALRVQALVALRQGCWSEAERHVAEARSLAQSMRYPWGEARVLQVYGDLHAQQAEPGPAREKLEAALAIFRQLGASKDAVQTEQALATLS